MSLINQVLQELEKRHAADPGLTSLPPQVRAVPAGSQTAIRALTVALILVLTAVGAFVYLSGGWPRAATTERTVVPLPDPVKKQTSAPVPATETAATQAPAQTPGPAPIPIDPAVQAVLLAPVSKLSEKLSFNPDPSPPAVRAAKPKPKTVARADKPGSSRSAAAPPSSESVPVMAPAADPPVTTAAPPDAGAIADAQTAPAESPSGIDKQMREMTLQQRAETAFRSGVAQLQDGRVNSAERSFREALKEDSLHVGARQALLGLLLDSGRRDEAEQLLRHALELNPRQPRHAMVLARLEVDRGELSGAINTLVGALPYVRSDPEYYAFLAALLQRDGRHRDAVNYYRTALQSSPGNAVWLMGLGLSLRANDQFADAREAFRRAAESKQLNAELQAFVERQLREMAPKR